MNTSEEVLTLYYDGLPMDESLLSSAILPMLYKVLSSKNKLLKQFLRTSLEKLKEKIGEQKFLIVTKLIIKRLVEKIKNDVESLTDVTDNSPFISFFSKFDQKSLKLQKFENDLVAADDSGNAFVLLSNTKFLDFGTLTTLGYVKEKIEPKRTTASSVLGGIGKLFKRK